jgi:hypothetical protein
VDVRRARRWSTRASDDGRHTGRAGSRPVRFRVAKARRELRDFRALLSIGTCTGTSAFSASGAG